MALAAQVLALQRRKAHEQAANLPTDWLTRWKQRHMKHGQVKLAFLPELAQHWSTLSPENKWQTGIGAGLSALGLIQTVRGEDGVSAPLLAAGGATAAAHGFSGGNLETLLPTLRKLFGQQPQAAPAVAAQASKFFNADGSPRILDIVKAPPDTELQPYIGQLAPAHREKFKAQLAGFQPGFGQRAAARVAGIDIEQQRQRLMGMLGKQAAEEESPFMKELRSPNAAIAGMATTLPVYLGTKAVHATLLAPRTSGTTYNKRKFDNLASAAGVAPESVYFPGYRFGQEPLTVGRAGYVPVDAKLRADNPKAPDTGASRAHCLRSEREPRGIIAHELGHARLANMGLNRQWMLGGIAHGATAGIIGGSVLGSHGWLPGAIAGTALTLPQLLTESAASHIGGRAAARVLGPRATFGQRTRAYLGAHRGLPTYAAQTALPMAGYAARKLVDKIRGKEAAAVQAPSALPSSGPQPIGKPLAIKLPKPMPGSVMPAQQPLAGQSPVG